MLEKLFSFYYPQLEQFVDMTDVHVACVLLMCSTPLHLNTSGCWFAQQFILCILQSANLLASNKQFAHCKSETWHFFACIKSSIKGHKI